MEEVLTKTGLSAEQFKTWGDAVAKGGTEGNQAFTEMVTALDGVEDATLRNQLGVEIFGTIFEDQGENIIDTILNMNNHLVTTEESVNGLNESVASLDADPAFRLKTALGELKESLAPLLADMAEFVAKMADWVKENDELVLKIGATAIGLTALLGTLTLLSPILSNIISSFKLLTAAIALIASPMGAVVVAIGLFVGALAHAYKESETFRDGVNKVFQAIKDFIAPIIDEIVSFAKEKLDDLKKFWEENGEEILSSVKKVWDGIQKVIEVVMPIIKAVVVDTWESIQRIIDGALNTILGLVKTFSSLMQGDFKGAWEGVKQIVDGAAKAIWGVVEVFILGKVLGAFKTLGTGMKTLVKDAVDTVVKSFKTMVTNIKSVFKIDEFVQLGKDVIGGFIKGITGAAGEAVAAVGKVFSNIISAAKKKLDSHSPSRVFQSLGHDTLDGYDIGLNERDKKVQATMTDILGNLLDITDYFAQEEQRIASDSSAKMNEIEKKNRESIEKIYSTANAKKRKLTEEENKKVLQLQQELISKTTEIEKKATSDSLGLTEKMQKEKLEEIKNFIQDRKSLDDLTLLEEARVWETSMDQFNLYTKERIEAQKAYQTAVTAINAEITKVNQDYSNQINKINEDLIKQEDELTKAYADAVDKRAQSLHSFKGLFDAFKNEIEVTGEELLGNLGSQVDGFKQWQQEIENLSSKAIDDGLLEELRQMGPNALPQLRALNRLTADQLTEYSRLYKEKSSLARKQAESELIGMKEDTDKQLKKIRNVANAELDDLKYEWMDRIKLITNGTKKEFETMETIGRDAGYGLLDGLSSTEGALQRKAKEIAQTVQAALKDALVVPTTTQSKASSRMAEVLTSTSSAASMLRNSGNSATTSNINNSRYMQPSITIVNQVPNTSPSELARKSIQAQRQLAMEWGV